MKTYINATASAVVIEYQAGDVTKHHTIGPGQRFVFDDAESNGDEIEQALIAAGTTEE